jgi:hypothetical protein
LDELIPHVYQTLRRLAAIWPGKSRTTRCRRPAWSTKPMSGGQRAEEAEHHSVFRPARWIVAIEVALSLVLLVVSGLFLKSFWKLATLDMGFDAKNVLLLKVDLHTAKVPSRNNPRCAGRSWLG